MNRKPHAACPEIAGRHRLRAVRMAGAALLAALSMAAAAPTAAAGQAPLTVDADVVILLADLSGAAVFYPAQINGNRAEFIAVQAPDKSYRVVINACQSCGDAGYVQKGDNFVCKNCGQSFHVSALEKQKGGCNPLPIPAKNKQVLADRVILPREFVGQVAAYYARGRR